MVSTVPLPDRGALYYPRLHFEDVDWLKATLLAFGRVSRIVPSDYDLSGDVPAIQELSQRHGAREPVIFEIEPGHAHVEHAQARLFKFLADFDHKLLLRRFGRDMATRAAIIHGEYRLHRSKIHDGMLSTLVASNLAWPETGTPFLLVHPSLGEAIMGVSAIAAARMTGSDVVTDAASLHVAVSALDEDALLDHLAARRSDRFPQVAADRATARLAHSFLLTRFDVSRIPLADVAGLVRDGADLRAFRRLLLSFAERVPPELDEQERGRRLALLGEEIDMAWNDFQRRLPMKLKAAFKGAAAESAQDLIAGAAAGIVTAGGVAAFTATASPTPIVAAAVSGTVPILLALVKTAIRVCRGADAPSGFRYLARISKAGGVALTSPVTLRAEAGFQ